MKLLRCSNCDEIFKLDLEPRACGCDSKTKGMYVSSDNENAVYSGKSAMPMVIVTNGPNSFAVAESKRFENPNHKNIKLTAFVAQNDGRFMSLPEETFDKLAAEKQKNVKKLTFS